MLPRKACTNTGRSKEQLPDAFGLLEACDFLPSVLRARGWHKKCLLSEEALVALLDSDKESDCQMALAVLLYLFGNAHLQKDGMPRDDDEYEDCQCSSSDSDSEEDSEDDSFSRRDAFARLTSHIERTGVRLVSTNDGRVLSLAIRRLSECSARHCRLLTALRLIGSGPTVSCQQWLEINAYAGDFGLEPESVLHKKGVDEMSDVILEESKKYSKKSEESGKEEVYRGGVSVWALIQSLKELRLWWNCLLCLTWSQRRVPTTASADSRRMWVSPSGESLLIYAMRQLAICGVHNAALLPVRKILTFVQWYLIYWTSPQLTAAVCEETSCGLPVELQSPSSCDKVITQKRSGLDARRHWRCCELRQLGGTLMSSLCTLRSQYSCPLQVSPATASRGSGEDPVPDYVAATGSSTLALDYAVPYVWLPSLDALSGDIPPAMVRSTKAIIAHCKAHFEERRKTLKSTSNLSEAATFVYACLSGAYDCECVDGNEEEETTDGRLSDLREFVGESQSGGGHLGLFEHVSYLSRFLCGTVDASVMDFDWEMLDANCLLKEDAIAEESTKRLATFEAEVCGQRDTVANASSCILVTLLHLFDCGKEPLQFVHLCDCLVQSNSPMAALRTACDKHWRSWKPPFSVLDTSSKLFIEKPLADASSAEEKEKEAAATVSKSGARLSVDLGVGTDMSTLLADVFQSLKDTLTPAFKRTVTDHTSKRHTTVANCLRIVDACSRADALLATGARVLAEDSDSSSLSTDSMTFASALAASRSTRVVESIITGGELVRSVRDFIRMIGSDDTKYYALRIIQSVLPLCDASSFCLKLADIRTLVWMSLDVPMLVPMADMLYAPTAVGCKASWKRHAEEALHKTDYVLYHEIRSVPLTETGALSKAECDTSAIATRFDSDMLDSYMAEFQPKLRDNIEEALVAFHKHLREKVRRERRLADATKGDSAKVAESERTHERSVSASIDSLLLRLDPGDSFTERNYEEVLWKELHSQKLVAVPTQT